MTEGLRVHERLLRIGELLETRRNRRIALLVLMVLTALVLGWSIWSDRGPTIFSDEAGTLGNARWVAGGVLWRMEPTASASNISYPLLIAPIFALVDSPELTYRLILLFNVFMAAAMVGVLYVMTRRALNVPPLVALAAAACAAAYPAVAVQVGVGWVEIAAMLGFTLFALTAVLAMRRVTPAVLVGNAAIAGFLSCLHGRFTVIPYLAIAGLLLVAVVRPRVRWWALGSAVVAGVLTQTLKRLEDSVQLARWGEPKRPEFSLHQLIGLLPWTETRSAAAQGWYLVAGTGGLVVLGTVVLLRAAGTSRPTARATPAESTTAATDSSWADTTVVGTAEAPIVGTTTDAGARRWWKAADRGLGGWLLALYLAAAMASIFFISASYMAIYLSANPTIARVDHLYYGRYNECMIPVLVAIAVGALLDRRHRVRTALTLAIAAVGGVALLGISVLTRENLPFTSSVNPYMMTALEPFLGLDASNKAADANFVLPAALVAGVFTLVLAGLSLRGRWIAPLIVVIAGAIIAVSDLNRVDQVPDLTATQVPAYEKLESRDPRTVAYDPKTSGIYVIYGMPFWLDNSQFVTFNSAAAQWPAADLYVGPAKWPQAAIHGLKLVLVEKVSGRGFYARSTG